jgi:protein TonB
MSPWRIKSGTDFMTRWICFVAAVAVHGAVLLWTAAAPHETDRKPIRVSVSMGTETAASTQPTAKTTPVSHSVESARPVNVPAEAASELPAAGSDLGASQQTAPSQIDEGSDPSTLADYLSRVHEAVAARRAYPYAARTRDQEGVVLIAFRLDDSGLLEEPPQIVASSGHPRLDAAAVAAVIAAAPFAPPPDSIRPWDFRVPVEFRLH